MRPREVPACRRGQLNRLDQRSHPMLRLAEIIWQANSPEHRPGALLATGFLFNVATLFENFLVAALAEELPARHVVRHAGIEIVCHALDLALPPEKFLAQWQVLPTNWWRTHRQHEGLATPREWRCEL